MNNISLGKIKELQLYYCTIVWPTMEDVRFAEHITRLVQARKRRAETKGHFRR
jgi:hypothetical protein